MCIQLYVYMMLGARANIYVYRERSRGIHITNHRYKFYCILMFAVAVVVSLIGSRARACTHTHTHSDVIHIQHDAFYSRRVYAYYMSANIYKFQMFICTAAVSGVCVRCGAVVRCCSRRRLAAISLCARFAVACLRSSF